MKKHIKRAFIVLSLILSMGVLMGNSGCEPSEQRKTEQAIQQVVAKQDSIYNKTEPIPIFNYSLPRHMWIQFYKATTQNVVNTWSCEVAYDGEPITEVLPTIGYPIPMDTQLTNPYKLTSGYSNSEGGGHYVDGQLAQAEPNGLYTSPNTNATIYFTVNDDGTTAPNYAETNVVCKPYPFHWDEDRQIFVRDKGSKASLKIDTEGATKK